MIENKAYKLLSEERNVRFWEYRSDNSELNSINVWNSKIDDLISGEKENHSIRVLYKNSWGFVSFQKIGELNDAIEKAVSIGKKLSAFNRNKLNIESDDDIIDSQKTYVKKDPRDISVEDKTKFCVSASKYFEKECGADKVNIRYGDIVTKKFYQNSFGSQINQELIRTSYITNIISKKGNKIESAAKRIGYSKGFEIVDDNWVKCGESALSSVKLLLNASMPNGGKFPIICDSGLTDVFIHEAVGHASEADLVLNDDSCLKNKLNKKITDDNITIVDDATNDLWGSFFYDDEGVKAKKTKIVENGVLKTFLTSRETALRLNLSKTGNARSQDSSFLPIVRMSNTYIEKGDLSFEEMLEDLKNGYYLVGSKGGQVNTKTGNFTFSADYGFEIKNGQIQSPVKGVSLSGNTIETLNNICGIENKYEVGSPGMCGKGGQSVPVIGNCPKIMLKKALVGGN
jgi:TldD protein